MEDQYSKFLELFKTLLINIPFIEAIVQMPNYAKFLKTLLANTKKMGEATNKLSNPGSFILPYEIGQLVASDALANIGARINLMLYSFFAKLGLGEPSPTRMSFLLAHRSVKYPRGIVENMLVKIGKYLYPADFVILDMDVDLKIPIILGRPFLTTARALVDVFEGKLTLGVNEELIVFNIKKHLNNSHELKEVSALMINVILEKENEMSWEDEIMDELC
ncbi:uncharacterized protein LOC110942840 [Helianthus annuus]|uniref:uncharacterized protein LOC110942840 n=1 Tax=Helianthus annuus TaxID=4232 RepID=UPI000B8F076E|nr:uncharacterized protein LOC110942840 [Helianthus annuus]